MQRADLVARLAQRVGEFAAARFDQRGRLAGLRQNARLQFAAAQAQRHRHGAEPLWIERETQHADAGGGGPRRLVRRLRQTRPQLVLHEDPSA